MLINLIDNNEYYQMSVIFSVVFLILKHKKQHYTYLIKKIENVAELIIIIIIIIITSSMPPTEVPCLTVSY